MIRITDYIFKITRSRVIVCLIGLMFFSYGHSHSVDRDSIVIEKEYDCSLPNEKVTSCKYDSLYNVVSRLIDSHDSYSKIMGYEMLLSSDGKSHIGEDSLQNLSSEYKAALESFFDEYNIDLTVYNKNSGRGDVSKWIFSILCLLFIMLLMILLSRIQNKNNLIELHRALNNIKILSEQLECEPTGVSSGKSNCPHSIDSDNTRSLRNSLRDELLKIYNNSTTREPISNSIMSSEIYQQLQSIIKQQKHIDEDDHFWKELETQILESSPNFKSNIQLLTGGHLSRHEFHTVMLIKCGVTPSQMMSIFSRSKGAISSRRESVCYKVFDKKMGNKVIDGIIRLL